MDQGRQILDLFRSRGLTPVLVLDDTDRWLTATWLPDSAHDPAAFFTTIPRLLSEELDAAAVIAVHPTYLDDDAFRAARGLPVPDDHRARGAVGRRGRGDPAPADRVGDGRPRAGRGRGERRARRRRPGHRARLLRQPAVRRPPEPAAGPARGADAGRRRPGRRADRPGATSSWRSPRARADGRAHPLPPRVGGRVHDRPPRRADQPTAGETLRQRISSRRRLEHRTDGEILREIGQFPGHRDGLPGRPALRPSGWSRSASA